MPSGTRRPLRPGVGLAALATVGLVSLVVAWARAATLERQAELAARGDRWGEVEDVLARRAWYGTLDPEALRLRAEAALRRGNAPLAAGFLREIPRNAHPRPDLALRVGARLLDQARLRDAEAVFLTTLDAARPSEEALRALIVLYGVEKRGEDQSEVIWRLHELGAGSALEALRLLAPGVAVIPPDALARGTDEAQLLRQACEADPDDPRAALSLAELLRSRGEVEQARRLLEAPALRSAELPRAIRQERETAWARWLLETGRHRELGERLAQAGPHTDPGWFAVWGQWCLDAQQPREAVEVLSHPRLRTSRDPARAYRLARALDAAGRKDEAARAMAAFAAAEELRSLAASIDDSAPDPAALRRAAELCRQAGREREARAWLALAGTGGVGR